MIIQFVRYIILGFSISMLLACGSGGIEDLKEDDESELPITDSLGNYAGIVTIDLLNDSPKVTRQEDGRTNVILQFIPRDKNGFPLSTDQFSIELKRDGKEIDSESHLESSSVELQFDVNFGLVLDTSYSMVTNEALLPMLTAAKNSIDSGSAIWKDKLGQFSFYTSWFNDFIFYSNDTLNNVWDSNDLLDIPAPLDNRNGATKLYAGIDFMVDQLTALPIASRPDESPKDQNIILVFSDGEDNYSHHDNSDIAEETLHTINGAEYKKIGYKATSQSDLITKLEEAKNLTVHAISLGADNGQSTLRDIARSGNGTFQSNPNANELAAVFDGVVKEFTTMQTHGARLLLVDGTYQFTLKVTNKAGTLSSEYSFEFETNSEGASIK